MRFATYLNKETKKLRKQMDELTDPDFFKNVKRLQKLNEINEYQQQGMITGEEAVELRTKYNLN